MFSRFNALSLWIRIAAYIIAALLAYLLITSAWSGIKDRIFGNPEVARQKANVVVAQEQTKAEGNIADGTIAAVREHDIYREHVTSVVHDSERKVSNAWHGETVGADVDAAGADALCRLHNDLCRGTSTAPVQPLR